MVQQYDYLIVGAYAYMDETIETVLNLMLEFNL